MKPTISPSLLILAALCFFFSNFNFAQNTVPNALTDSKIANQEPTRSLPPIKQIQAAQRTSKSVDCDNDVNAPIIQCPYYFSPTARAMYMVTQNGEPWGDYTNINAMDAVFGSGSWDYGYFDNTDLSQVLTPAYKVVFLEASQYGGYALENALQTYLPALENWVSNGGSLFINCASNYVSSSTMNLGFGGAVLQNYTYIYSCSVPNPAHPIFNTPFSPANGDFYGSSFLLNTIADPNATPLIVETGGTLVGLAEKTYGKGKVYFGGLVMPYYQSPQPNVQYLRYNILADLDAHYNTAIKIPTDLATCFATIADASLDATATDDCVLASLIHDFTAAPVNTTLQGAVFPVGLNSVTWTATDLAGNTGTCQFYVYPQETELPTITCPTDISVNADPNACGTTVNFTFIASDNCLNPVVTSSPSTGTVFPNGITVVTAMATDASGNTKTCTFSVNVAANPEICNGIDDDCDGYTDEGAPGPNPFYADNDYDGYGDLNQEVFACIAPLGYVTNALDCDDANYYVQPGMYEYCNGIDDNCDGQIDEGVAPLWYADADGDGFGDPLLTLYACSQPIGYTPYSGDCDDTEAYINPNAMEDCTNNVDENCDGIIGTNIFAITETHTNVICGNTPDGSINITVLPAQNYPLIKWSNGSCCSTTLTNLTAGTYKVTVTNECGTTQTKTIVIQAAPNLALQISVTGADITCAGDADGNISVTTQGGCATYNYAWTNGATTATITDLEAGYYGVQVTDACGCVETQSYLVNEPYQLALYTNYIITLLDGNYWVQVVPNGGTGPYTFRRSIPSGGFTNWTTSNGFGDLAPGTYTFEVLDQHGCTGSVQVVLDPFAPRPLVGDPNTGTTENETESTPASARQSGAAISTNDIKVFPNPTAGELNIEWSSFEGSTAIQIMNSNGQLLRALEVPEHAVRVMTNVVDLPSGTYFVHILSEGKAVKVLQFVKS